VGVVVLEPDDLGGAWVGKVAIGLHLGQAAGKLGLEVPVAAVEHGP
jgi:hypothetical protein